MRNRISITLKKDIIEQVDRLVDGMQIRSRSQAIEYLLAKTLTDIKLKTALVLAGGEKEDFKGRNRFMMPIKGKPILSYVIEHLASFNVNKILVYVDCFKEEVMNYFKNGNDFHVSIEYLTSDKSKGNIQPLLMARKKINDTFIVFYGDTISSIDLADMLAFHRQNQNIATVALTTVSNPKDYGIAVLKGNKVMDFKEKPEEDMQSFLVSSGIFIFEPRIFNYIGSGMKSIEKDLLPYLVKKQLLTGYTFQGKWLNINTKKDFKKALLMV
ncbi:MAG: sugar phosphate nucleotidyltransferase [Candidatus Aenigmarchaeota archaeon]|nr:sugar phosphate nucleotidyltransferase [Candidatus Aenigmarchaeota archaeon]